MPAVTQALSSPPYTNYFLSTCHVAGTAVVTAPTSDSNDTIIGPRLVVAFPGGNSGIAAFWEPQNGENGTLAIQMVEQGGQNLSEVYIPATADSKTGLPAIGLQGVLDFNNSAALNVALLGSVRTIRDFTEGPSILVPKVQDAIKYNKTSNGHVVLSRLWLDNVTTTTLGFMPSGDSAELDVKVNEQGNHTVTFTKGRYVWYNVYDYPQLEQFKTSELLNHESQDLITQESDKTTSLAFLSYTDKLLAGTWRFLTYFGRDSMIATLLLQPVLSTGEGSPIEAVIGAVLERINRTDGSVCHEETLGDYATYLNEQMNITSTAPSYSYPMIDTDYYLPILMDRYFLQSSGGMGRARALMATQAGLIDPANKNLTWGDQANTNAEKLMSIASQFAVPGNQTKANLAQLKADQIVGQWRDSTYGIGGGRVPYDVNTGLMPAALRSIAALSQAGIYPNHANWGSLANTYADVWETETLPFFQVTIPADEARQRLQTYVRRSNFSGPSQESTINEPVNFHAISLNGYNDLEQVQVMNTDSCFRLFLVNGSSTGDQSVETSFLNQTATNVRQTFPVGLMTDVGMLVANPAFGEQPEYAANWTTSAYHGTVVWSWPQAMMAKGFENQLMRCNSTTNGSGSVAKPQFCTDQAVVANMLAAYNTLWDAIEANTAHLSEEVWSWQYENGAFQFVELGALPPPPGTSPTGELLACLET